MKIIVTGGGTGGHIYPAVAIAKDLELNIPNVETLYVGTRTGIESEVVPLENMKFVGIDAMGFSSKKPMKILKTALYNFKGCIEAFNVIRAEKPNCIIGTGGYASAPMVFIGGMMGVPTMIHEQNVVPGRANQFLSQFCNSVFITYPESAQHFSSPQKVIQTGNPVRDAFKNVNKASAKEKLGWNDNRLTVLSFGGSGGAKKINDLMMDVIEKFNGNDQFRIVHVTGRKYYDKFLILMSDKQIHLKDNITILPYIQDMPEYMAAANIVISRSGATSLAELMAVQTPSILIPSPNVKDNHQEYNARIFEKCGMALVIPERELSFVYIETKLQEFQNKPEMLSFMHSHCKALSDIDPLSIIRKRVQELIK